MKNRGCQRCIRASLGQYRNEVLWFAGPARCDHRNARGADNRSRQLAVKASLHTVGIHGSEQNLSCSEGLASLRPFDGIDSLILPAAERRASIASTTACAPNSSLNSRINSGRRTAAVLTLTLSAPDKMIFRASATVRIPPPTVSGINTLRAVRATRSAIISRASLEAVISRNTSSSAPCAL